METSQKKIIGFIQFKIHERVLKCAEGSFESKVVAIMNIWRDIRKIQLCRSDIEQVREIIEWAKLHTLNIVLQSEWDRLKVIYQIELINKIHKAIKNLTKLNIGFKTPLEKLINIIENPWDNPILLKLMKNNREIGPEEAQFFYTETIYVVTVRLKKLCDNFCEDLALNLSSALLKLLASHFVVNMQFKITEPQVWFIFDVHIALLYKFEKFSDMLQQLKRLSTIESLQLVQRFSTKKLKIMKLWKNSHKIACIASQLYITKIVLNVENVFLKGFIDVYSMLCKQNQILDDFINFMRRICSLANSDSLNVICEIIGGLNDPYFKMLLVEIYIRILTIDINELEIFKNNQNQEEIRKASIKLANIYDKLAVIFDEHVKVARECVLTSFCLEPTKQRLCMLENYAARSGFQVEVQTKWKCSLHPPVFSTDELMWKCSQCNDWMCKPQLNVPVGKYMPLHETIQHIDLGISQTLCDDLIVCLSYSRYQLLSWMLPWNELHRLCVMYLQNPVGTKNFITELKFVDIDYSIFKNIKKEPLDEIPGIEKGYEQYLDYNLLNNGKQLKNVKKTEENSKKKSDSSKSLVSKDTPTHVTADFQNPMIVLQKLPKPAQTSVLRKVVEKNDQKKNLEVMRMKLMIKLRRENITLENGTKK